MTQQRLPNGWQVLTIDQLKADADGSIVIGPFGSRMKANCYVPFGVPVIRGNNLSDTRSFCGDFVYISDQTADSMKSCNACGDDLVFPHRGAIGEVGIVPRDGKRYMISTSLMKLTCNRDLVNPLFLFYFFRSSAGRHELLKNSSTVGTPGIGQPLTSLRSISVPLPPRREQDGIAGTLGSLDDKIVLNRRTNETLEAMARALFKSWFVDFDPLRAKREGRRPAGMDKATAALFPDSFQDSPLGEIPKEWKVSTVGEIALVNDWTLGKGDELKRIEYVEISEVMRGAIQTVAVYERGTEPSRARRRLRHGDTVMSTVRPDRGAYFLCLHPSLTLIASTGFAVLTPRSVPWSYLYAATARTDVLDELGRLADGGAYPAVRPDVLAALSVVIPGSGGVLDAFHASCKPSFERADKNRRESRDLAALLPKLLSGEIRVRDAERRIEEVI